MKDDKKKLMIIGALVLVMLCIGAFQFTKGSGPAAPPPSDKKEVKDDGAKKDPEALKNPLLAAALPQRDPFKMPESLSPKPPEEPKVEDTPKPLGNHSRTSSGGRIPEGFIRPMNVEGVDSLPNANGNPTAQAMAEPPFPYQLSGVIVGHRPMAVFIDSQGNQRLIALGGALDGDTKVTAIEKGRVTVQHGGKTLQLTLGGNPSEK